MMKKLLIILALVPLGNAFSQATVSASANVNDDLGMTRVKELYKVFIDFTELLHGTDVNKARKYLSDGVLAQCSTENLQALAKHIKADKKIELLSHKMEYDTGRSGLELIQLKYEGEPYPYEIFQVVFDKTNHIAFINSTRPDRMETKKTD